MATHGADGLTSTIRSTGSDEPVDTFTSQAIQKIGIPRGYANFADAAFGVGLSFGTNALLQSSRYVPRRGNPFLHLNDEAFHAPNSPARPSLPILNPSFTGSSSLPELIVNQAISRGAATPKHSLVLWSGLGRGGIQKPQAWAKANEGITVELTSGGRWLHDLDLFREGGKALGIKQARAIEIWGAVSKSAVERASGQVRVLLGNAYNVDAGKTTLNSVYGQIERPALIANPNITGSDELYLLLRIGIR